MSSSNYQVPLGSGCVTSHTKNLSLEAKGIFAPRIIQQTRPVGATSATAAVAAQKGLVR